MQTKPSVKKTALLFFAHIMPALHIFNPGHEMAVLLGAVNYTPPANVRMITADLSLLPLWYAESSDFVYVEKGVDAGYIGTLPKALGPFATIFTKAMPERGMHFSEKWMAKPWGISPHILNVFNGLSNMGYPVEVPDWKEQLKILTGRQTAIDCLRQIAQSLPVDFLLDVPECCDSIEAVEAKLTQRKQPLVIKAPYSSSGRGILWLRDDFLSDSEKKWISGAILKQGFVSMEKGYDKVLDFAMEFHSDGCGRIRYEGLSVFGTERKGAYTGNRLASQDALCQELEALTGKDCLSRIRDAVEEVLQKVYAPHYFGCLGVDMMIYRKEDGLLAIHPCVEINMRYTMGMVALQLFRRYIAPLAEGSFHITFDKEKGVALAKHNDLLAGHPLQIEKGKISQGYLSLCPVNDRTHYRAYLIIP